MSRYHCLTNKDVAASELDVDTANNKFLITFPEREELDYSLWRTKNVGAMVYDTSKATITGTGDAIENTAVSTGIVPLFGYPGAVAISNAFMGQKLAVEE